MTVGHITVVNPIQKVTGVHAKGCGVNSSEVPHVRHTLVIECKCGVLWGIGYVDLEQR